MARKNSHPWQKFWLQFGGTNFSGRIATRLAEISMPPYYDNWYLSDLHEKGYIASSSRVYHNDVRFGKHVYIGARSLLYQVKPHGGPIDLSDFVHITSDTILQTGHGGSISIGEWTCIQPFCQISAHVNRIQIGNVVAIAPRCGLYPYNHGMSPHILLGSQPLVSKGKGIIIEDDAWLGYGVVVLDNVTIGKGAIVGANSVVNKDIPPMAIAAGVPARVLGSRNTWSPKGYEKIIDSVTGKPASYSEDLTKFSIDGQ